MERDIDDMHGDGITLDEPPPSIIGVTASNAIDEDDVLRHAAERWERTREHAAQIDAQQINFASSPIAISFIADLHLGNDGVDYPRIFDEAQIITETPGMYLGLDGDLLDNFIVPKLLRAMWKASITVEEQWVLVKKYLRLVSPKLLFSVAGNHEKWSYILGAIDYFRDVTNQVNQSAIYSTDDVLFKLRVKNAETPIRARHYWRGASIYNVTHGIERAFREEGNFRVGVGAHTHQSGLAREFNAQTKKGLAILCGSYKRIDTYARDLGLPRPNNSTAVTVLFFDDGYMLAVDDVAKASDMLRMYRRG